MHRLWSAAAACKCINIGYKPASRVGGCDVCRSADCSCTVQGSIILHSLDLMVRHTVMLAILLHADVTVEMGALVRSLGLILWTPPPHSQTEMTRLLGTVASLTAWKALLLRCSWHRRAHLLIGVFPDRRERQSQPCETVWCIYLFIYF